MGLRQKMIRQWIIVIFALLFAIVSMSLAELSGLPEKYGFSACLAGVLTFVIFLFLVTSNLLRGCPRCGSSFAYRNGIYGAQNSMFDYDYSSPFPPDRCQKCGNDFTKP